MEAVFTNIDKNNSHPRNIGLQFVGELMSEENLRAVMFIGGGLTIANILSTSVDLDRWYSTNNEDQRDDDCLPIIDKRSEEVQQTVRFKGHDVKKKANSKAQGHRKIDMHKDHDVISYDNSNVSAEQMTSGSKHKQRNLPQKKSRRERGGEKRDEKMKRPSVIQSGNQGLPPGAVVIDMEHDSPKRDTGLNTPIRSNSRSRQRPSEPNVVQNDRGKKSQRATDRRSTRVRQHTNAEHAYTPAPPVSTERTAKPRARPDHHSRAGRTVYDKSGTRRPERERDRGHDRDDEKRKRSGRNQTSGRDRRGANGVIEV